MEFSLKEAHSCVSSVIEDWHKNFYESSFLEDDLDYALEVLSRMKSYAGNLEEILSKIGREVRCNSKSNTPAGPVILKISSS